MSEQKLICVALSNELVVIGDLINESEKAIALKDVASVHHVKPDPEQDITEGSLVVSEIFPSCVNLVRPVCFSYDQVVATFAPSDILLGAYDDWCQTVLNMAEDAGEFSE